MDGGRDACIEFIIDAKVVKSAIKADSNALKTVHIKMNFKAKIASKKPMARRIFMVLQIFFERELMAPLDIGAYLLIASLPSFPETQ